MANFQISPRTTVVVWVALALGLAAALVLYINRPVRRVSLPHGTMFPACLLEPPAKTCDESDNCVGNAPGGLTYAKGQWAFGAENKLWCCPQGTSPQEVKGVPMCIVP
jgi:hypothetical protein